MPMFGIRYTSFANAEARLPFKDWTHYNYAGPYNTFDEAKAAAAGMEEEDKSYEYYRTDTGETIDTYAADYTVPRRLVSHRRVGNPRNKWVAYKLPESMDYASREEARQNNGEYTLLPDHMWEPERYNFLYPRIVETEDGAMIGQYDSADAAMHDRLTKVKPTRFFSRWTSKSHMMWDFLAELGLVGKGMSLLFVNSREDIKLVYENGPDSCMAGKATERFSTGGVHPTEAYASPDLCLAVLIRGESLEEAAKNGTIMSRALCNAKTMQYVRIYGDEDRMQKLLDEQGYSMSNYALGGCRLLKIFCKDSSGRDLRNRVITPYLDGGCQSIKLPDINADFMEIEAVELRLSGSTDGYYRI